MRRPSFMSKSQFAACARKAAYTTSVDAEASAGGRFGVYLCPICTRYHLTSAKPGKPAADHTEEEEKPIFDDSLLSRAKLKQSKPAPVPRIEVAVCLGKPRPDGRVRLKLSGEELLSKPVQPASLRAQLKAGSKVRVKTTSQDVTVLGSA